MAEDEVYGWGAGFVSGLHKPGEVEAFVEWCTTCEYCGKTLEPDADGHARCNCAGANRAREEADQCEPQ